jgi:hypothetical protein
LEKHGVKNVEGFAAFLVEIEKTGLRNKLFRDIRKTI